MEPKFFSVQQVIVIQRDQINRYGGSHGLRDIGLLESAVAQPEASFGGEYLHADLYEMAAAYLYHWVQNHAFIDGNKRVGAATALAFLYRNGVTMKIEEDPFADFVLDVASGRADKATVADFFRMHAR